MYRSAFIGLLFLLAVASPSWAQATPTGALGLGLGLSHPSTQLVPLTSPSPPIRPIPQAPPLQLSAFDAVRTALAESLPMRTAVNNLLLQAQSVATVARAEFSPKLGTSASTQRVVQVMDNLQRPTLQTTAALDLNWRLRTGANIKLSNGLTRSLVSGQPAPTGNALSLSMTQPLLRGAGREVTEAALVSAESNIRVAIRYLGQTAQALVIQVLGAYVAVQQAQAATQQARVAYELAQRVHELNIALVDAGRSPRSVVLRSESDLSAAQLGIAQAENAQRQAVRALALAMGQSNRFDGFQLVLTDKLDKEDEEYTPDEQTLVAKALDSSAELFAAQAVVSLAELALKVANDGLLPSLALSVGSTLSSASVPTGSTSFAPTSVASSGRGRDYSVGVSFEYSFDQAPTKLAKSTAEINLETARAQLMNGEQQVRDAAVDALRNLTFARAQYALARTALALANQQLDSEVTRQELGRVSQLELTNAQQALAAANRQLLDAGTQVFRSRAELAQIDGTLLQKWRSETVLQEWIAQVNGVLQR